YHHHHVLASTNKRTERWVKLDKLGIILPTSSPVDGGGGVGDNTLPDEHYVNDLVDEANITQRFSRPYPSPYRGLDGGEEEEEEEGATVPTIMQYMVWRYGYREDRARLRDQMSSIERKMHDGRAEFDTLKGKREKAVTALPALDPHYDVTSLYDDIDDDHHQDDDGSIGGKVYRIHTTEGERALSTRATATAGVEEEQQQQQSMMLSTATTA
ncbi:hypothetical protein FOZ62_024597, partial [Perkinsus olseni]